MPETETVPMETKPNQILEHFDGYSPRSPFAARLTDGDGSRLFTIFGPPNWRVDYIPEDSGWEGPGVDNQGFLVSIPSVGSYWFQPDGVAHPEYVFEKLFMGCKHTGDGFRSMAAVVAFAINVARGTIPHEAPAEKIEKDFNFWLEDHGFEHIEFVPKEG